MEKRKNGFTLIELIAVLVILAILAIIVTPIVLNIVKKAKDIANKRSVDAYGKTVELSVATYMLDNGEYPTCQSDLKIEYSGNEVNCNIMNLNENGSVYLSECTVGGKEVKDSSTYDGWYHYGEISTNEISKYKSYNIGDEIEYNSIKFYVISKSDEDTDYLTLLKDEPLTVDEVNTYGGRHVNMYNYKSDNTYYQTAYDSNGYGGMTYYSSETCGYVGGSWVETGCTTNYAQSEIKYVVDGWTADKLKTEDLKKDSLGYKARLMTYDELVNNLGYEDSIYCSGPCHYTGALDNVPKWVYNNQYTYWTMSQYGDSDYHIWSVDNNGDLINYSGYLTTYGSRVVRPVINLYKSAIDNRLCSVNCVN